MIGCQVQVKITFLKIFSNIYLDSAKRLILKSFI